MTSWSRTSSEPTWKSSIRAAGRHCGRQRCKSACGTARTGALAPSAGSEAEPEQAHRAGVQVYDDVRRPDVLVDDPARMQPGEGGGETDAGAQEAGHIHRSAHQAVEGLAARILQQQHRYAVHADEVERTNGPRRVQLGPQ